MKTECTADQLEFHGLGRRVVAGQFDGGKISSDSGGLLLREVEQRTHSLKRLTGCFTDHRNADQIEHSLESLIKQRVMGLALGYEDLNDHDALRQDPLLALLSDVADPTGQGRKRAQDKGCALAGKSTLNRLESRTTRIAHIVIHKSEPPLRLQRPLTSKQNHGFAVIRSILIEGLVPPSCFRPRKPPKPATILTMVFSVGGLAGGRVFFATK